MAAVAMGRGKIVIRRIENTTHRQVTFSKRRNGILKKAREISILCDAYVSVVIFSSSGKMSEYCTPSTTLSKMLERYQIHSGRKIWEPKHERLSAEIDHVKKENDSLQIELRHLMGQDLNSLNPKELIPIEEALQNGVNKVRDKQMEIWKMLNRNAKILEEENKQLTLCLQRQQLATAGELNLGHHHHQKDRELAPQMTLAFHVQSFKPNLLQNEPF